MLLSEIKFVTEAAQGDLQLVVNLDWDLHPVASPAALIKSIRSELNKIIKLNDRVEIGDSEADIYVNDISNQSSENLEKISRQIIDTVSEVIEDHRSQLNHGQARLEYTGLPKHTISWEGDIIIKCQPNQSIAGISKLISNSELIEFQDSKNIVGGVLDLLRLDKVDFINFSDSGKWQDIVKKHYDGDKDPIDCQQDLIEAGQKAFALFK